MANKGQAYKVGLVQGQTQEKARGIMGGVGNQAEGVKDKAFEIGQVAKDKVTGTPPPQTATDKVKGAACGAGGAVKNTIGMGGENDGSK